MPLKEIYTDTVKRTSLRWFKYFADHGRGIMNANYFESHIEGVSQNITRNLYHDVTADTVKAGTAIPIQCYILLNPPKKVALASGMWSEQDELPILMYAPVIDSFIPKQYGRVVVEGTEGYMADRWEITQVKESGQGIPLLWVMTIKPERNDVL